MLAINRVYYGDCLEYLQQIDSESVDLVIVDIPYNQGKAFNTKLEWDTFNNEYIDWVLKGFTEVERILKKTGSFYFFHNDFEVLAEIQHAIKQQLHLNFKQLIVWNKRFDGAWNKGYLDGYVMEGGRINYQKMCEYICFYTKQPEYFPTPFSRIIQEYMAKLHLKQIDIAKLDLSESGGITGWVCNKIQGTQLPNEEQWAKMCSLFGIENQYSHLEAQFWKERYTFHNQKKYHSVWNFPIPKKTNGEHPCKKPIELIENILLHSSNKGDLVVDYCAGGGNVGIACKKLQRSYILIDKDLEYVQQMKRKLSQALVSDLVQKAIPLCSESCQFFHGQWCLNSPLSSGKHKKGQSCVKFKGV